MFLKLWYKIQALPHPWDKVLHILLGAVLFILNLLIIYAVLYRFAVPIHIMKSLSGAITTLGLAIVELAQWDVLHERYDWVDGTWDLIAGLTGVIIVYLIW